MVFLFFNCDNVKTPRYNSKFISLSITTPIGPVLRSYLDRTTECAYLEVMADWGWKDEAVVDYASEGACTTGVPSPTSRRIAGTVVHLLMEFLRATCETWL